jgi:UDP-N-acetylglucosamine 1-carboxyvinyltransferase
MAKISKAPKVPSSIISAQIPGSKNGFLPHLYATLLMDGHTYFHNAPVDLLDSIHTISLLESIGLSMHPRKDCIDIYNKKINLCKFNNKLVFKTRYSILLLGLALAYKIPLKIPYPGGCRLNRGLDIHFCGLRTLGSTIEETSNLIIIQPSKRKDNVYKLRFPSVGATLNLILASILGDREVKLINVSCEPEVVDFINFINNGGGLISWVFPRTLNITPVTKLSGSRWTILPDRIVTFTYIVAALMLKRKISLNNSMPEHLKNPLDLLHQIGADITISSNKKVISVSSSSYDNLKPFSVTAEPFPGFPTDLQPIVTALASCIKGKSTIIDNVMRSRFYHIPQLKSLGLDIHRLGNCATVMGNASFHLNSNTINCSDIRGGMACILYALSKSDNFFVDNLERVTRGYNCTEFFSKFDYIIR